jgi:hypothetical protein
MIELDATKKPTTIIIDSELHHQIKAYAYNRGETMTWAIELALKMLLDVAEQLAKGVK